MKVAAVFARMRRPVATLDGLPAERRTSQSINAAG